MPADQHARTRWQSGSSRVHSAEYGTGLETRRSETGVVDRPVGIALPMVRTGPLPNHESTIAIRPRIVPTFVKRSGVPLRRRVGSPTPTSGPELGLSDSHDLGGPGFPEYSPESVGRQKSGVFSRRHWLETPFRSARAERFVSIAANLIGAAGAVFFAQATLQAYLRTHRLIGAAFFAEQMWVVIAYLIRRPARRVSRRLDDWLLAFGARSAGCCSDQSALIRSGGSMQGLVFSYSVWRSVCCPSSLLGAPSGSQLRIGDWYGVAPTPSSAIPSMPPTYCFRRDISCRAFRYRTPL